MPTKLVYLGLLPLLGIAQVIPDGIKYDLTNLTYPRIAQLARVQGTVKLELVPNETGQEIKFVSGPSLLIQQARDNLARWRTNRTVAVSYVFKLMDDPEIVRVRVPKGNAFWRLWLRMFHLATYTEQLRCKDSSVIRIVKPRLIQESPLTLELEINGAVRCIQTETSLVASR